MPAETSDVDAEWVHAYLLDRIQADQVQTPLTSWELSCIDVWHLDIQVKSGSLRAWFDNNYRVRTAQESLRVIGAHEAAKLVGRGLRIRERASSKLERYELNDDIEWTECRTRMNRVEQLANQKFDEIAELYGALVPAPWYLLGRYIREKLSAHGPSVRNV